MLRAAFFTGCFAALVGCASLNDGSVTTFDGASYRQVRGEALRTAFVGNKIRYPDPQRMGEIVLTSAARCDAFFPDGRYVTCGDRAPIIHGTYAVQDDRVCATVLERARCWQLFRGRSGEYLLSQLAEHPIFERIDFVSVNDRTAPPMYR
jgi:hypothetical protein